ncbi:MAG: DNA repair protein RecO [Clostridia bacterium]|nr:DNA repair protein RecO [Clostridia bacterium]
MHLTASGIVLKVSQSGDSDRFCTLLTDSHGVISAFAKGARSMKNKNATATAQFVYGHYELFRRRDTYIIDESQYEELYTGLREDIFRLSVAQYLCQLTMELVPGEQPAGEYLQLMRAALWYLSENSRHPLLVKAAAEMRMLSMAGYMPDLVMCRECGAYEHDLMFFVPSTGRISCGNCGVKRREYAVKLGRGAMTALRHSVYADLRKLFAFTLSDESLKQFSEAAEAFALSKTEKRLSTLAFLKTMM